jgi:hypothetical protein
VVGCVEFAQLVESNLLELADSAHMQVVEVQEEEEEVV